jgi:hypothetical protein
MLTPRTFTEELALTVATMQAERPDKAEAIGRAHAAIIEGHVRDNHDGTGRVLSRTGETWYTVNAHCECTASDFHKPCRHLSAWKLYQHVLKKAEETTKAAALCASERHADAGEPENGAQSCAGTAGDQEATLTLSRTKNGVSLPPLPEAPCSANVHVTIGGKDVLVTVRGHSLAEVLPQIEAVVQRYPVAQTPLVQTPAQTQPPPVCEWHGTMKESSKAKGTWYCPSKMADGTYCAERWPVQGR